MSVLVKGMKMPESCGACKLSVQVSMSRGAVMRCRLLGVVVRTSIVDPHDVLNQRYPNCPLVALPDKHGRLVDADALIEDVDGDLTDSIAEGRAIEKIMEAPTIVEAEDSE